MTHFTPLTHFTPAYPNDTNRRPSSSFNVTCPIPTSPLPVVTAPTATEFPPAPPARPVAEVHPQTHAAKPVLRTPSAEIPPTGAAIEKVTLPPPPTKSPVKKTSKVETFIGPRGKWSGSFRSFRTFRLAKENLVWP